MINWAYIAGFYDGEGSLSLNGNKGFISYVIHIPQAIQRKNCLDEIYSFLKNEGIRCYLRERKSSKEAPNRSRMYAVSIAHRQSIMRFIEKSLPFLIAKKTHLQDVYRFLRIFPSLRSNGDLHGKICQQTADKIKSAVLTGRTQADVAREFGVHHGTVGNIVRGTSWRGVKWN